MYTPFQTIKQKQKKNISINVYIPGDLVDIGQQPQINNKKKPKLTLTRSIIIMCRLNLHSICETEEQFLCITRNTKKL